MAKKKRKRKPQPGAGADVEQKRRERLEARRQAKAEAVAAQQRAARRRRVVRLVAYAGIAAALVWFFFIRPQTPDEIRGHPIQKFAESGVNEHVTGTVNYDTIPPVSGPHAGQPAPCGVHPQPIPNENLVHSFEHGAVALLFQPNLDIETIREIESIVGEYDDNVLSAPYPGMEPTVVVASWGEKMNLDEFDGPAIREYADVFRGRGPEGIDCPSEADQPFQPAPAATVEPTPSPEPTES